MWLNLAQNHTSVLWLSWEVPVYINIDSRTRLSSASLYVSIQLGEYSEFYVIHKGGKQEF